MRLPSPFGKQTCLDQIGWVERFSRSGDVLFDIGANVGALSRRFREIQRDSTIVAVEPCPTAFVELVKNVSDPVHFVLAGAWSEEALLRLHVSDNLADESQVWRDDMNERDFPAFSFPVQSPIHVGSVTLDSLSGRFGLPDIVKIDVEGSELFVIEGGVETLRRARVVMIEVADLLTVPRGYPSSKIHEALEALDFDERESGTFGRTFDWVYWRTGS